MASFVFRNIQKDHIVPSRLKLRPLEKRAIDDENGVFWRSLNLRVDQRFGSSYVVTIQFERR